MDPLLLSAIASAAGKLVDEALEFLFRIFILVAFLFVLSLVLPKDPFQGAIIQFSGTFAQWSDMINYFVPVRFILTSYFFFVVYKYFIYVYKLVMSRYWDFVGSSFRI